jgi:hypothetical protein
MHATPMTVVEDRRRAPEGPDAGGRRVVPGRVELSLAALLGFAAGCAFWHLIGFWGFVSEAVLYSRTDLAAVERGPAGGLLRPGSAKGQGRAAAGAVAAASNCSIAQIGRGGQLVQLTGCAGTEPRLHPPRNIARADRGDFGPSPVPVIIGGFPGAASGGWSARIEAAEAGTGNAAPAAARP